MSELQKRIVSGIVLAAVVLVATWYGGIVFKVLMALAVLLIYHEWSTIVHAGERSPRINLFGWIVAACCAVALVTESGPLALFLALIGGGVACLWGWLQLRSVWIGGGVLYATLSGIALSAIRGDDTVGLVAMLFVFAIVWSTDVAAFFTGRALGGPKLAPRISPSKTWTGAVGGAIAGLVAGTIVCLVAQVAPSIWIPVLSLLLAISSEIGDLFESYVKRRFGAKDSGRLIPGHGGVMDRMDGLVFAAFAAYLAAILIPAVVGAGTGIDGFSQHFLAARSVSSCAAGNPCDRAGPTRI